MYSLHHRLITKNKPLTWTVHNEHLRRQEFDQVPHEQQVVNQVVKIRRDSDGPALLPLPASPLRHLQRGLVAHGNAPIKALRVVGLPGQHLLVVLPLVVNSSL